MIMPFARAMLRRWDIVRGEGDAWEMVVKTTADVGAGEQLLLSYGERCSDDFFLHYGMGCGVWECGRVCSGGRAAEDRWRRASRCAVVVGQLRAGEGR